MLERCTPNRQGYSRRAAKIAKESILFGVVVLAIFATLREIIPRLGARGSL